MDSSNFCLVCDVTFTSETHAESHYRGKKHRKKADFSRPRQPGGTRRNRQSPSLLANGETASDGSPSQNKNAFSSDDFDGSQSQWQSDDVTCPKTPNESGHLYYCNPCMKNFSGPSPMKQHMASPSHEKQVKKLKAKSAKESCRDGSRGGGRGDPFIPYWKNLSKTGQARTLDHDRRSESSDGSTNTSATPTTSERGTLSGAVSSLQRRVPRSVSPTDDLRCQLITMCTAKLKTEVARMIPAIVESIVDSVLCSLSESQKEEMSLRRDETSPDKNGVSTHRMNVVDSTSKPPTVADEGCQNGGKLHLQSSTKGTRDERNTAPASAADDRRKQSGKPRPCSSSNTPDEIEILTNEQNHVSQGTQHGNLENGSRMILCPGGADVNRNGNMSGSHEPIERHQSLLEGTREDGPGVHQKPNQIIPPPIFAEGKEDGYVEIYGVQIKKGATNATSGQSMSSAPIGEFDMRSTTQRMATEGDHYSSVTSQDLIDFEELRNSQNEHFTSRDTQGDPTLDEGINQKHPRYNHDSGIDCKSWGGCEEDQSQEAPLPNHESGGDHVLSSQPFCRHSVADDEGVRQLTGKSPPEEDLKNLVGEIINAIDFESYEGELHGQTEMTNFSEQENL